MDDDICIMSGFPPFLRKEAAALYLDAFGDKLGIVLGRDGRAAAFIAAVLEPEFAVSAVSADGTRLLGIAGYKTGKGAMVGGGMRDLAAVYGWPGALWRAPLSLLFERENRNGQLLMDGIAVRDDARGRGIGTRLLTAVCEKASVLGCTSVRLDVIDTNPRARALYARNGFVATKDEDLGLLRHVFGFSKVSRMERTL
ncbi:hypothetical protein AZF01_13350 [Martelella sp. AD-3]|nr:hypothetical protein AZF01_13350 [Martelella sp. AD-3]